MGCRPVPLLFQKTFHRLSLYEKLPFLLSYVAIYVVLGKGENFQMAISMFRMARSAGGPPGFMIATINY